MHVSWDLEKLFDEKKQGQKILWHCPFKMINESNKVLQKE
jgi:hypothetical protein